MELIRADRNDIHELYALQLLAFQSEADMIGSRSIPALMESEEDFSNDFEHWITLKLVNEDHTIIGAIRYKEDGDLIDVGRLMIHPDYRRQGLAQRMLHEVDIRYPQTTKELYTCTKSWTNIALYKRMGYQSYKEHREPSGLSFVYMRKGYNGTRERL